MNDLGPGGTPLARGYRPQDLPQSDPEYGPGDPPPECDREALGGWLPVETYATEPNLRVVALECAAQSVAAAVIPPQAVLTRAKKFLEWLEADE